MKKIVAALLSLLMVLTAASCSGNTQPASSGGSDGASTADGGGSVEGGGEEVVPIRVALFTDGNDMSATQKAVFDAFIEEYPNIHPQFEYITSDSYGSNWNGYLMKIQTMIAGNDAPDVIALGLEGVAMMAMNDMALPLNDFIDSHQQELAPILEAQNEDLMKIFEIDGNIYSIPYEANCVVTHINKDIFEEAGIELPDYDWTWDEFVDIC